MKRIVAFCLSLLLIGVAFVGIEPVQAAANSIEIVEYSVAGVLDVNNVYAVTMKLKWKGHNGDNASESVLKSLTVESTSPNYKQVRRESGQRYTIINSPMAVASTTITNLNKAGNSYTAQETFYFLKIDGDDTLNLKFTYKPAEGAEESCTGTVLMIKSVPDPTPPVEPPIITDPTPVDTSKYQPLPQIVADTPMPLLTRETEELILPITNTAIYAANKIVISLEPVDREHPLFSRDRIKITAEINTLSRDQVKEAKFPVALAPGAQSGRHLVALTYVYANNHGDRYTETETIFIQVDNSNAAPRLEATSSQWLKPGMQSEVKFKLKNAGLTEARNIKATLEGLDPNEVSLLNDVDVKYVNAIAGGGSGEISYLLFAAKDLRGSSTRLTLVLEYTDEDGVPYGISNTVFLPISGEAAVDDDEAGVPRLIISRYDLDPQEIKAGSDFTLFMNLRNTSQNKTIGNLKVTIQSDEGIFLPVDASNTIFIESIAPGETAPVALRMNAKADAENKSYPLRISFDYEDNHHASYNAQEMITVPVTQNSRLVVGDVMFYGEPYLYDMLPVNVEFYNLGKTTLYNLMVRAEGPFRLEGERYFVGNFHAGASDSFGFALIPEEAGELEGMIVFEFEDSLGASHEVTRELKINVMEPFDPGDIGPDFPMPVPQKSNKLYYVIGAGAIALALGAWWFIRRRKKRQALNLLHAEDFAAAKAADIPQVEYVNNPDSSAPSSPDNER